MRKKVKIDNSIAAEWVDIKELKVWEQNPRINDKAIEKVIESIRKFGFSSPIVARKENNEIISGHTRVKAAKSLGISKVPVRFMDLGEKESRLLAIADNKLSEESQWDMDVLQEILETYDRESIELAGWNEDTFQYDEVDLECVPTSKFEDAKFWISIKGPIEKQIEVMDKINSVKDMEDLIVEIGVTQKKVK